MTDPANLDYQRDLSISYERLGDVARGSDPAEAARRYRQALDIAERLAAADPANRDHEELVSWLRARLDELDG